MPSVVKIKIIDDVSARRKLDYLVNTCDNATRCAGQAVGIGHMREHAMVCSDYAIKTLNCSNARMEDIQKERSWQYDTLKALQNVL